MVEVANRVIFKGCTVVIAAAQKAKVDFLVTLDRKHLLGKPALAEFAGVRIVTPREVVDRLLKK